MYPNKSPSKQTQGKSGLGNLLLSEKGLKSSNRSALVSPVLQQVGKLAAGVANVASEFSVSGSATGNPRNKVALQPGHSLMDWIRLGASGKDLTGVGSKAGHLAVTKLELSRHNKMDDIWIAVRGKVYNVTAYVPFHPGGPDELMRAAGIDATRLFDQVHPWVNYDQILQKCFIGRLAVANSTLTVDEIIGKASSPSTNTLIFSGGTNSAFVKQSQRANHMEEDLVNETENSTKAPENFSSDLEKPLSAQMELTVAQSSSGLVKGLVQNLTNRVSDLPKFDWIQKLDSISIIFYTKALSNPMVEIYPPKVNGEIIVAITYDNTLFENELAFYNEVQWPCSAKVSCETGKVELTYLKKESGLWENYGRLRQRSKNLEIVNSPTKFNFVYKNRVQVTHNIFLLELERTDDAKIIIPIGKHIRVFVKIDGEEYCRSYTPVPKFLFSCLSMHSPSTDIICLMIKRYNNGNVSCYLTDRIKHDVVYLTKALGDIDLRRIERKEVFLLLAAGTGITPMFGLLLFLLERRIKKCQFLRLLFFNRTEKDIPFRSQFDSLAESDSRFRVNHILSEPDDSWTGLTGHISKELLENSILDHIKDTGYTIRDVFVFVCGPNAFLTLAVDELFQLEFLDDQIHTFQG